MVEQRYPRYSWGATLIIVAGQRDVVAAWVCARVRDMAPISTTEFEAIGFASADGTLIGGAVYTSYYRLADGTCDITLTGAGNRGWLSRTTLRVIFGYPFGQLNCSRVTAITSKPNRRSRDLLERLGFRHEGTIRGAFGRGRDGLLYGLLREEYKFSGEFNGKKIWAESS